MRVAVGGGGVGSGRIKRVSEHKGLASFRFRPCTGTLFPFLSLASLRQQSEREINNLSTLSVAWGVAVSSQGKPVTLPPLRSPLHPTGNVS